VSARWRQTAWQHALALSAAASVAYIVAAARSASNGVWQWHRQRLASSSGIGSMAAALLAAAAGIVAAARSARALLISIKNISGSWHGVINIGGSKIIGVAAWRQQWRQRRKHQKKAAAAIGENGVARSKMAAAAAWRKSNGGIGGSGGISLKNQRHGIMAWRLNNQRQRRQRCGGSGGGSGSVSAAKTAVAAAAMAAGSQQQRQRIGSVSVSAPRITRCHAAMAQRMGHGGIMTASAALAKISA
jgi:hypothetical protein